VLKGTVSFTAAIKGNGIKFPLFAYDPKEPGVETVEIEANGDEIRTTVHFVAVASEREAVALATKVNTDGLDRIAFHHAMLIDHARVADVLLTDVNPAPGVLQCRAGFFAIVGHEAKLVHGVTSDRVKALLEQATPRGKVYYGLVRSARLATSSVEEFMVLYQVVLMLIGDRQEDVDRFIVAQEPGVPQMPSPHRPGIMETVYTRLRNELAHKRAGVNLDTTRAEMRVRVDGLRALVKLAVEQFG
jgi:hypothetical protein